MQIPQTGITYLPTYIQMPGMCMFLQVLSTSIFISAAAELNSVQRSVKQRSVASPQAAAWTYFVSGVLYKYKVQGSFG